jgi:hypothetical protein
MSLPERLGEPVFSIEPVLGWRSWRLSLRRERIRLYPIGRNWRPWSPLVPTKAACGHRRLHRAPAPRCTCGLYGAKDAAFLERAPSPAVIGTAALWGRVVEHELGYRGEFGYPQRVRLVCPECLWWPVSRTSCAHTVVVLPRGAAVPLCEPHLSIARECGLPIRFTRSAWEIESALLSTYAVDLLPTEIGPRSAIRQPA